MTMTMSMPTRRNILQVGGLQAASVLGSGLWGARAAQSQTQWADSPFALGVASGAPTHNSVVLWTRLMVPHAAGVAVKWEMAHDEGFSNRVQQGTVVAVAGSAHAVHAEVEGLESDRWYFYRFIAGNVASVVGRTRTFPAPGSKTARLRLAYASCQKWEDGYFSAYAHMARENLDAVLFLGDYIYEYPGSSKSVRRPNRTANGGWLLTLEDYRSRYACYKSDPDLQAMHAACPWLVTWDDHEVQNDYGALAPGFSGDAATDFIARRAAAYQAYYEHMPLRASTLTQALSGLHRGQELRLYSQVRYGDLAQLYLLDTRQYRDPQVCTPDGKPGSGSLDPRTCAAWHDPARTLLGHAQEQWLGRTFRDSAAATQAVTWNIIGQQTLFGQRDFRPGPDQFFWNDGWDGYAPARQRLTRDLQQFHVSNPVFFGGDVHENWVGHVKADYNHPHSAALGVEFCGTSITSRSSASSKAATWLVENPHFVFADTERKGYGVAEFTSQGMRTTLRVVDQLTQRSSQIATLAEFEVEAGRAVIARVGGVSSV